MSTVVKFQGKNCIEPGSYAATTYNPTSVVNVANFGNAMIIDTGLSVMGDLEFAGGAGIKGVSAKGLKAIYEFTKWEDFAAFMGGGILSDIARKLFTPADGVLGIPKLYYTRAATTTPAVIELDFSTQGTFTLTCKNEGITGNGVAEDSILKVGYAAKVIAAAGKFKLQIYKGTYQGIDADGESYGVKNYAQSIPDKITESPEVSTIAELYDWAIADKYVLANFIVSKSPLLLGTLSEKDLTLAAGGTTVFLGDDEFAAVLESIVEIDNTFFLCTKFGTDGADTSTNGLLYTFLKTEAKFQQFMVVGGGEDDADLFGDAASSEALAKYYDDGQVVVIHGAPEVARKDKNGVKKLPTIYHAASVIGLKAGTAPQIPLTFKRIGYENFVYPLKKKEREKALQLGIMHVRNVAGYWCINQGITTLQDNKKTISEDGQSLELSIELIKAQLNKEIVVGGEVRFTGNDAAQVSPETLKNYTETKLATLVARPGSDNLILSWRNVQVAADNGDYTTTYDFVPNVPVNKTFWIGNMLDYKANAQ